MTQKPRKNPFRPGVGTRPLHLAGRDQPMRRFAATLRAAPEQPANMRLTGLRGVGKTVLLGEFQAIAENGDWASAMLEFQPGHNAEATLVTALASVAQEAKERLSKVERIKKAVGGAARRAGTLGGPANVNVLLGRLVDNGVLYRLRKGEYDYTAPRFRDYLLRRTDTQTGTSSDPITGETLF